MSRFHQIFVAFSKYVNFVSLYNFMPERTKIYTNVSFIPFFVFCFLSLLKIQKYYIIFVYILQCKMGKLEKNIKKITKVTKIPNTKRQKYGMNETMKTLAKLMFARMFSSFHQNQWGISTNLCKQIF